MGFCAACAAMIKENLKRYWLLTAISLAGYLTAFIAFGNAAEDGIILAAYCLAVVMPSITAALVMRRLRKAETSPGDMIARLRLMNSTYVSGLVIAWLPVLAAWALCLLTGMLWSGFHMPGNQEFLIILCAALLFYSLSFSLGVLTRRVGTHVAAIIAISIAPFFVDEGVYFLFERLSFRYESFRFDPITCFVGCPVFLPLLLSPIETTITYFYIVLAAALYLAFSNFVYALKPFWSKPVLSILAITETAFCSLIAFAVTSLWSFIFGFYYELNQTSNFKLLAEVTVIFGIAFILTRAVANKTNKILNRDTFARLGMSVAAIAIALTGALI